MSGAGVVLLALQAVLALSASAEMVIAYPKDEGLAIRRPFRDAAQEIAADLRESAGLDCRVVEGAADVKPPAICLGAAYAAGKKKK